MFVAGLYQYLVQSRFFCLNIGMKNTLTQKQLDRLQNTRFISDHLVPFINGWISQPDIPEHILDIMIRLSQLTKTQQREFLVFDDELHAVKYTNRENYIKYQTGWRSTKRSEISMRGLKPYKIRQ